MLNRLVYKVITGVQRVYLSLIYHPRVGLPISHLSGIQTNTYQAFLVSPRRDTSVLVLIYHLKCKIAVAIIMLCRGS